MTAYELQRSQSETLRRIVSDALAGPIQNYRITGDPRILRDAELTVDLFDRFYLDRNYGGYFSHLDPVTLDPLSEALGANKGKKKGANARTAKLVDRLKKKQ